MVWVKRLLMLAVAAAVVGAIVYALMPQPVEVDLARLDRGPLRVTVGEEGTTRIRDVYRVSAPIAGRVARSTLRVGDEVEEGETVVATIRPADPPFIDLRTTRELEAAVAAAKAAVGHAEAEVSRADAALTLARSDLQRAQRLAKSGTISARALEKAVLDVQTGEAQVNEAEAQLELRRSELRSAEVRLMQPGSGANGESGTTCCVEVKAPVSGVVLALPVDSEQVLPAGTLLAEIGSTSDLEIVVDLLSSEALRVPDDAEAIVSDWGGAPLAAKVRRIDPAAFTKVSALGIEEQRVNVVLDLAAPAAEYARLGHGFRVYVDIVVWEADDVLRLPLGALFRSEDEWAAFVVEDGTARLRTLQVGHRNDTHAEVTGGLAAGEAVILHPSDRVVDGVAVLERGS